MLIEPAKSLLFVLVGNKLFMYSYANGKLELGSQTTLPGLQGPGGRFHGGPHPTDGRGEMPEPGGPGAGGPPVPQDAGGDRQ
jgi:hypothetical protein